MTAKLDIDYFEWLISQVDIPNGKSYRGLFDQMHCFEFLWTVPNDDNRIADGSDLRVEFLNGSNHSFGADGVSFLEVLIALSRRTAFTAGGEQEKWAWRLIKNLRLHKMSDPLNDDKISRINDILYAVVWRTYQRDGRGGFFPLNHPLEDQTQVEIWYQMNKYVIDMHSV